MKKARRDEIGAIYASELYRCLKSMMTSRTANTCTLPAVFDICVIRGVENYAKNCDECAHVSVARVH